MKKFLAFIREHEREVVVATVLLGFLISVKATFAFLDMDDVGNFVISMISDLTVIVANLLGKLISFFIYFLVIVAQYDGFASAPAVTQGWVIMRDFANMGIVIGLLIIAFGSAFNSSKYQLNKGLASVVIVAIVVNFSKTLTLILIDVSQVAMLTFVNAFKSIGTGNFATILGVEKFFDVSGTNPGVTVASALAALLFTIIAMVIVLATIIVLTVTLMVRVIALWFIIVLSPIMVMAYAVPSKSIEQIKSQWWEEFTGWLLIGPFLAFFIWLTFVSLQGANNIGKTSLLPESGDEVATFKAQVSASEELGALGAGDQLAGFVIAIGMLLMGLKFSFSISGSAGKVAGKAMTQTKRAGRLAVKPITASAAYMKRGIKEGGAAMRRGLARKVYEKTQELPEGLAGQAARLVTKRGREEMAERATAHIEQATSMGTAPLLVERKEQELAQKRMEDFKLRGAGEDKKQFQDEWKKQMELVDSGKADGASLRALAELGATEGWLEDDDYEGDVESKIKSSFGIKEKVRITEGMSEKEVQAAEKTNKKIDDNNERAEKAYVAYTNRLNKASFAKGKPTTFGDRVVLESGEVSDAKETKAERKAKLVKDMQRGNLGTYAQRKDIFSGGADEMTAFATHSANFGTNLSQGERNNIVEAIDSKMSDSSFVSSLTEKQFDAIAEMRSEAAAKYEGNYKTKTDADGNDQKNLSAADKRESLMGRIKDEHGEAWVDDNLLVEKDASGAVEKVNGNRAGEQAPEEEAKEELSQRIQESPNAQPEILDEALTKIREVADDPSTVSGNEAGDFMMAMLGQFDPNMLATSSGQKYTKDGMVDVYNSTNGGVEQQMRFKGDSMVIGDVIAKEAQKLGGELGGLQGKKEAASNAQKSADGKKTLARVKRVESAKAPTDIGLKKEAEAAVKEAKEAQKIADKAKKIYSNAEQKVREISLQYSSDRGAKGAKKKGGKYNQAKKVKGSHSRVISKIPKDIKDLAGSKKEGAAMKMVQGHVKKMKAALDDSKARGGDSKKIKDMRKKVDDVTKSILDASPPNQMFSEKNLEEYRKVAKDMEQALNTMGLF